MQFKLSSCFATHSEAVAVAVLLVVECPNLHRPPAIIPTLHPSSINLAALFSSSPLSLIPSPYYPSQSHYNIYTLQQKSSISISIFPYKYRLGIGGCDEEEGIIGGVW